MTECCELCEELLSAELFGAAVRLVDPTGTAACTHRFHRDCLLDSDNGNACIMCGQAYLGLVDIAGEIAWNAALSAAIAVAAAASSAAAADAGGAAEAVSEMFESDLDPADEEEEMLYRNDDDDAFALDEAEGDEHATFSSRDAEVAKLMQVMERVWEDEDKEAECAICLSELGADAVELDACTHQFCVGCITRWAERSNTCPECNTRFTVLRPIAAARGNGAGDAAAAAAAAPTVAVARATQHNAGSYLNPAEYAAEERRLAEQERRSAARNEGRRRRVPPTRATGTRSSRRQRVTGAAVAPAAAPAAPMPAPLPMPAPPPVIIDMTGGENNENATESANLLRRELSEDLGTLTCIQLRARLSEMGASKTGRKRELVPRLVSIIMADVQV